MHKLLLNSVLLCPIVSRGVRAKPPGQTPLGHKPLCFLPFVGRICSGVRAVSLFIKNTRRVLSHDVLWLQKTGYDQGGCYRGGLTSVSGVYRRARHKHFVVVLCEQRTTRSARRSAPSVAALFITLRHLYGWQHCTVWIKQFNPLRFSEFF